MGSKMPLGVKFSQFQVRCFFSLCVSSHYGLKLEIPSPHIFKGDIPFP